MKRILILLSSILVMFACSKEPKVQPKVQDSNQMTVVTSEATNVSTYYAELSGKIVNPKTSTTEMSFGVCYSLDENMNYMISKEAKSFNSNYIFTISTDILSPEMTYYYRSYLTMNGITSYGEIKSFTTPSRPVPQTVDLGLSVKWASYNIDASKPEEFGRYYIWGDVEGGMWSGSKWSGSGFSTAPTYGVDSNNNLNPEYDAAHVILGGRWRMPTKEECQELIDNCTCTWTGNYNSTGVAGRIFTSNKAGYTDKSIFLPAAGYVQTSQVDAGSFGQYWSSTYSSTSGDGIYPFGTYSSCLAFNESRVDMAYPSASRYSPVRPVYGNPVSSVSISASSASIYVGYFGQLTATVSPANAGDKSVIWSSSNESVATVSSEGLVTGVSKGTATITVTTEEGGYAASCKITVTTFPAGTPIDLGLSVKWSNCNIGAFSPEEYGYYLAWGDVTGQTMNGSKWSGSGFSTYPTYEVDSNNNLKPEYDAAHVILGGTWRMPTKAECQELIDNCTCTWTDNYNSTGVAGRIFTSKKKGYTKTSIFLPAAGDGNNSFLYSAGRLGSYWSSTFYNGNYAWYISFHSSSVYMLEHDRSVGFSVRPVTE